MAVRAKSAKPVPAETAKSADVVQIPAVADPPKFVDPYTPQTPAAAEVDRIVQKIIASGKAGDQSALESAGGTYSVIQPILLNTMDIGAEAKINQSERAKEPRPKIVSDDGETITSIIGRMALSGEREESAKELWIRFRGELDALNVLTGEVDHPTDLKKSRYKYKDAKDKEHSMTFGQFSKVVSDFRTEKKLP